MQQPPNPHARPAVEVQALTKVFRARAVLDAVDLSLLPGSVTALTGRSGEGKTTLLRLIAGLDTPDAGRIFIAGQLACEGPRARLAPHQRGIGMVFQQAALWPHMNVADHLRFGLGDMPAAQARARVREVLDLTGIAHLAAERPARLSGGEAARVAIARALAPSPDCLLLDEPLAHLHDDLRHDIARTIRAVADTGSVAVLFVTHTPADLDGIADRRFHLEAARLTPI
ncbi:ABC transporter ATP-binding protein [Maritimibacter sp. HL-12]|uniref:ABC transporter ATP-binding protein n=1 Tax=Maritimibacter sp. HL-12 TaxID=1162418 RepID=UPI000A0F4012|nr:ATP-binding cassette domain-containing protein [Maritimibacter sp. HL-12]SMH30892.1 iron(III) transport system ATP-binding protein [Maritimibacter sp. HL-12]